MIFNISGGGGTALNFRVVKNPQPTNPSENCIWVNTETPITSWVFSADEPSPAEAGMVWFSVGKSSTVEFNALKKNGIQVYPISAKQYVSGAWVDVEAQSYQGGAWVEWLTYVFKSGTGAIVPMVFYAFKNQVATDYTSEQIDADGITFFKTVSSYGAQSAYAVDPIDLTGIDTIYCKARQIQAVSGGDVLRLFVSTTTDTTGTYKKATASVTIPVTAAPETYALDVSNLTGSYYVGVGGCGTGYVADIWY